MKPSPIYRYPYKGIAAYLLPSCKTLRASSNPIMTLLRPPTFFVFLCDLCRNELHPVFCSVVKTLIIPFPISGTVLFQRYPIFIFNYRTILFRAATVPPIPTCSAYSKQPPR
ncbi:hypothetical protein CDAR_365581 [Caerostris darwini]|uniref:Uncharacterized protein n=1 Tax=Caerostris darwini TaxID=1538125 RepID=A0AAV4RFQ0_9ARAC|nr:hypothetical protein CDAR_365581 [Caerostris darwini]